MMSGDYCETLDSTARARYLQKLSVIGTECPYRLPKNLWKNNPREWPYIEYPDVYDYLIRTPGVYTRQEMQNYKSLRSNNLLASGWIRNIYHHKIEATGITIFKADVTPSFRTTATPHHSWVAASENGYIVAAHCDCKAGLGESCTHVGGVLYKLEMTCRMGLTQPETCTDVPCSWNNVAWDGVAPDSLSRISFYNAEKKKERCNAQSRSVRRPDVEPSAEEKENFLISALNNAQLPIGLSTFRSTVGNFISTKPVPIVPSIPQPLRRLIQSGEVPVVNNAALQIVEECTREQASSLIWHEQRSGRITSSVIHDVLKTNSDHPSTSTILKICSVKPQPLNVPQLTWGREHEKDAIALYKAVRELDHPNFKYQRCGLHILESDAIFAASPDGLIDCDCCGEGTLEVKCPYTLKELKPSEWSGYDAYSLDNDMDLKPNHPHYFQVQHHMHVTNRGYCDYVLWSPEGCKITRIFKNSGYGDLTVPLLKDFWQRHIRAELVSGTLEKARSEREVREKENTVHCSCGEKDGNLPMVGCDNKDCAYKRFHLKCLGLKAAPRLKTWYCKNCRPTNLAKKRKVMS